MDGAIGGEHQDFHSRAASHLPISTRTSKSRCDDMAKSEIDGLFPRSSS